MKVLNWVMLIFCCGIGIWLIIGTIKDMRMKNK